MVYPSNGKPSVILLAEDNLADREIITMAFSEDAELQSRVVVKSTSDGLEVMNYLQRQGVYANPKKSPRPDLIVLDIALPLMDGKSVLNEIKSDDDLKDIPVVMFTTSENEKDVAESYALGANAYLTKPDEVDNFTWMIKSMCFFWLFMAKLPRNNDYQ